MTGGQLYLLAGMVAIGWRLTSQQFGIEAREEVLKSRKNGREHWQIFMSAIIATAIAVLTWPIPVSLWVWKFFK